MQESPLTAQDRLADLVTFTDFSDTLLTRRHRPEAPLPIGGLDMLMTIRIDQAVRLNADITPTNRAVWNWREGATCHSNIRHRVK